MKTFQLFQTVADITRAEGAGLFITLSTALASTKRSDLDVVIRTKDQIWTVVITVELKYTQYTHLINAILPVLRIRIRKDPYHFSGSGSVRIRIIFQDPDPFLGV